jgi:hypothetical protein
MTFVWKILELFAEEGRITSAKYHCAVSDDDNTVETEGYWSFPEAGTVPFDQVTEEMIAGWIEQASIKDGQSVIKSRLEEQLKAQQKPVPAPWMPQVFTPNI